jgi:hypothetical protein
VSWSFSVFHKTCKKRLTFNFIQKTRDFFQNLEKSSFIYNSFTRKYSVWYALMRVNYWNHKRNINPRISIENWWFKNRDIPPVPTSFQLRIVTFKVPTWQPSQNNTKLAIKHKDITSSILVLIPVIHENKWYLNCLTPSFPLHSELSDAQLWYISCSSIALIG